MANIIGMVVSLVLSIILMANVLMPTIKDTDTTNWTSSEKAMWGVAGLGAVVGIVYSILAAFGVA